MANKEITLSDQLAASKKITENYNSDAQNLLHEIQLKKNEDFLETRKDDHRNHSEIEAEAQDIIRRAHNFGEILISERHRHSPLLFFYSGDHLILWKNGATHDLGSIRMPGKGMPTQNGKVIYKVSHVVATDIEHKEAHLQIGFEFQGKVHFYKTVCEIIEGRYIINPLSYVFNGDIFNLIPGLNFESQSTLYTKKIVYWRTTKSFAEIPLKVMNTASAVRQKDGVFPRITDARTDNRDEFYVLHPGKDIIVRSSTDPERDGKIIIYAGLKNSAKPIGLAYHTLHDSLLVKDAAKNQIFLHFPNEPAESRWRSFSQGGFIPIPNNSFTSGINFSITCLLRFRPKPKDQRANPQELVPKAGSNFGFWFADDKLHIQYAENRVVGIDPNTNALVRKLTKTIVSIPKTSKIPDTSKPEWFQLGIVKSGVNFKVYVGSDLIGEFNGPHEIIVREAINLACPGYMMAELRVWNKSISTEILSKYQNTWLPVDEFDGLTAYWHLYVTGKKGVGLCLESMDKNNDLYLIQEPDLSGHGHHMTVQKEDKIKSGELNYHTYILDKAPSPFQKNIPLYTISTKHQGFQIDDNTGRVFWTSKGDNGKNWLFSGTVLGHVAPIPLFETGSTGDFSLVSQKLNPYQELIIAHAEKRMAMEHKLFSVSNEHKENRERVLHAQQNFHDVLTSKVEARAKAVMNGEDNKTLYAETYKRWTAKIQEIHNLEKKSHNELHTSRLEALDKVRKATRGAQEEILRGRQPKP